MATLEEVVRFGQGIERPFRCHKHDDHQASASVNVLKGLWYCFACGARGRIDKKKAPTDAELAYMLNPDVATRVYPESYLDLFVSELGNFAERFPPWVRWCCQLGHDPLSGDSTFPVRTPNGQLAGVGRRRKEADPVTGQRYAYPPRWSASRSLFTPARLPAHAVLCLVEGAADAAAVAETGCWVAGMYGSGLHQPQIEQVMRYSPQLVLIGTDADKAGQDGAKQTAIALAGLTTVEFVDWSKGGEKDPAALDWEARRVVLAETVVGATYGARIDIEKEWDRRVKRAMGHYIDSVEEAA